MISGQAGVGKTALALHAAHRLRPAFPDGQLYANLRGSHPQPFDPRDVLGRFLVSLGVDGRTVPETLEQRSQLFRTRLAGRRVLVVLDDAVAEAQVRPLLPGTASSAVLVTTRHRLLGVEAAHRLDLEVLEPDDSVHLLATVVGQSRIADEAGAAREIARLCGHLPLALRVAGAKLAAKGHWSLGKLVDRLSAERHRLDELVAGDLEVRASIELSYRGCDEGGRRLFRLLGVLPWPDFPAWVAGALLDVPVPSKASSTSNITAATHPPVSGFACCNASSP